MPYVEGMQMNFPFAWLWTTITHPVRYEGYYAVIATIVLLVAIAIPIYFAVSLIIFLKGLVG